jgi:cytochrome P450
MAATETTERAIVSTALALLVRPDLALRLSADAASLAPLVDEVLRLHPPELMVPRVALQEIEIGGIPIPAGARVMLCLAAANRDPKQFPNPGEIDLERGAAGHVSFGAGIHRCSGTALARAIVPDAVARLFADAPTLAAAEPLGSLPYHSSVTGRTPDRLLVERRA